MKHCEIYEEWISAFLDGELGLEQKIELQAHMAVCPECQRFFDDLVAIPEALMDADGEEVSVPEGFADQVMARVRETRQDAAEDASKKVIRFPHWRRWAAMAACCAVVLLGVWSFQGKSGQELLMEKQAWVTADVAPRMAREADMPAEMADSEGEVMLMMDEDLAEEESGLAKMANSEKESTAGGMLDDAYTYTQDNAEPVVEYGTAEAAKDAPVPAPAAVPMPSLTAAQGEEAGTLVAGGDVVRQWVEEQLGLDWVGGEVYLLTEEQYDELAGVLTEAGVDFRVEPGDRWGLKAE